MHPKEIARIIRRELDRRGTTAYRACLGAGLPGNAIRYALEGRATKSERLAEICEALDLEFYIGPPRDAVDSLEKVADALGLPRPTDVETIIEKIELLNHLDPATLQTYLEEAEVALQKWRSETIDAVAKIVKQKPAVGEAVTLPEAELEDDGALASPRVAHETALVPDVLPVPLRREVRAAAGGGALNDDETIMGYLAFRRDWLAKYGLNAKRCSIIEVSGDSMDPTLEAGAMILMDLQRVRRRQNRIFVVGIDDGTIVKRLVRKGEDWQLVSDNRRYKPRPWPPEARMIGQVIWTGRTL